MGAWRLVSIDQLPREGTDTVDFNIKLTPADKYLFDINVEGSKNWGNPLIIGDLGIGTNLNLQNRNFARRANHASTNLRYGIELNVSDELLQTNQVSLTNSLVLYQESTRCLPVLKKIPAPYFLLILEIRTVAISLT